MLVLPTLQKVSKKDFTIAAFAGLNRRSSAGDKTLSHTENMSMSSLPVLSTRMGRVLCRKLPSGESVTGMFNFDKVYFTTYGKKVTKLYYGDSFESATCVYTSNTTDLKTSLVCKFDGNICIFNMNKNSEESLMVAPMGAIDSPSRFAAPDFADVAVFDNRIFGCRQNQIWACATGDYKNWGLGVEEIIDFENAPYYGIFENKSDFSCCVNYKSHVLFFTQDEVFQLRGSNATNYDLVKLADFGCLGRQAFCEVAGVLYFLSKEGVIRYNGNSFSLVSDEICDRPVSNSGAVLGAGERTLYVKMNGKNGHTLYTYNTETGYWAREDAFKAVCALRCMGNTYFALAGGIYQFEVPYSEKSQNNDGLTFPWEFETQQIHCYLPLKKRSSKLNFYIKQDAVSKVDVLVSLDSAPFMVVGSVFVTDAGAYCIPLSSQDYQSIKIKLRGHGQAQIHYISHSYSMGGM